MNPINVGDRVAFDVEGIDISPYGYGTVVLLATDLIVIKPDNLAHVGLRFTNIRGVELGTI